MAKKCMMRREARRTKLRENRKDARAKARAVVNDPNASFDDKLAALTYLKKKVDSSSVRRTKRCPFTGRARGAYSKKVLLGRGKLRLTAMNGEIPGLVKASW